MRDQRIINLAQKLSQGNHSPFEIAVLIEKLVNEMIAESASNPLSADIPFEVHDVFSVSDLRPSKTATCLDCGATSTVKGWGSDYDVEHPGCARCHSHNTQWDKM